MSPRRQAHLQNLAELEQLAMVIARHLSADVVRAPENRHRAISAAFDRLSLGIRRCVLLAEWLEAGAPQSRSRAGKPKPKPAATLAGTDPKQGRSRRRFPVRIERVERIDLGPNPETALEDGRVDAYVDAIRAVFGIEPGRDNTPTALAARLIAQASRKPIFAPPLAHPPDG